MKIMIFVWVIVEQIRFGMTRKMIASVNLDIILSKILDNVLNAKIIKNGTII